MSGAGGPAGSADRILPEHQHLDVGDVLLDGAGCDATHGAWTVRAVEPGRWLVLFSSRTLDGREIDPRAKRKPRLYFDCSWAFVLVLQDETVTRLLVRSRIRMVPARALQPRVPGARRHRDAVRHAARHQAAG